LGFSLLPPLLASAGYTNASKIGYKFYSVLCHQLAFRSYFINGEQIVYPRELANIPNLKTYEEITGKSAEDIRFARDFIGNDQVGYKFALCQRDVAIYLGLGLFGLLFQLSGKKIKKLPWLMWVLIALIPIALDGTSQLPGLAKDGQIGAQYVRAPHYSGRLPDYYLASARRGWFPNDGG